MSNRTKGNLFVIASAVAFGFMAFFAKTAYAGGGNMFTVLFFRFAFSVIAAFLYIKVKGLSLKITGKQLWNCAVLGVIGFWMSSMLLYGSYNYIPTGLSTTLHFCYPVLILFGSVVFQHKHLSKMKIGCAISCIIGMICINTGIENINLFGVFIAFCSAITFAFYCIYFEECGLSGKIHNIVQIFYMNIFMSSCMFIATMGFGEFTFNMSPVAWICIGCLSITSTFAGILLFQKGLVIIGAQNAGILSTLEPTVSLVVGAIVFHEKLGILGVIGCFFILAAAVVVAAKDE